MTKLRLEIELDYDMDLMHTDDADGHGWFKEHVLSDAGQLILHSNEIGDAVGAVRVIRIVS